MCDFTTWMWFAMACKREDYQTRYCSFTGKHLARTWSVSNWNYYPNKTQDNMVKYNRNVVITSESYWYMLSAQWYYQNLLL